MACKRYSFLYESAGLFQPGINRPCGGKPYCSGEDYNIALAHAWQGYKLVRLTWNILLDNENKVGMHDRSRALSAVVTGFESAYDGLPPEFDDSVSIGKMLTFDAGKSAVTADAWAVAYQAACVAEELAAANDALVAGSAVGGLSSSPVDMSAVKNGGADKVAGVAKFVAIAGLVVVTVWGVAFVAMRRG